MIFEVVKESAKGALVRRGQEMIGEVISNGVFLGDAAASAPLAPSAPGFSVGATAFIALTSGVLGGLAGWALCDLFSSPKRSSR